MRKQFVVSLTQQKKAIQCIESLDVSIEDWGPFLVYMLQTKLDKETAIDWEKKLGGSRAMPKYSEMIEFLEIQHRIVKTPSIGSNVAQAA